uniref:Uncharacterized protein n=1 Tax=Rousettus aegyptiacus TaxID=9407 RepID=A0A7J8BSW0_ROUAE|nr:hypothetical protein HJG63_009607 [Rousettus aegyptiacus]
MCNFTETPCSIKNSELTWHEAALVSRPPLGLVQVAFQSALLSAVPTDSPPSLLLFLFRPEPASLASETSQGPEDKGEVLGHPPAPLQDGALEFLSYPLLSPLPVITHARTQVTRRLVRQQSAVSSGCPLLNRRAFVPPTSCGSSIGGRAANGWT